MEDPWGSPWANDSPPKIDLPAPPPSAHFAPDHSPQRLSPARTPVLSPWDDADDAWGGWAEPGKDNSPRWGRSPGLKPLDSVSRLPSPAPVSVSDAWGQLTTESARTKREDINGDFAFRSGDDVRPLEEVANGRFAKDTITNDTSNNYNKIEDVWARHDKEASIGHPSPAVNEQEARPGSPEGPPQPALDPTNRPKTLRQPSLKVQDLVVMYDGMAQRSQSVSPVDFSGRKVSGATSPVDDVLSETGRSERDEEEEEEQGGKTWAEGSFVRKEIDDKEAEGRDVSDEGTDEIIIEGPKELAGTEEQLVSSAVPEEEPGKETSQYQESESDSEPIDDLGEAEKSTTGRGQFDENQTRRDQLLDVLGSPTTHPEHQSSGEYPGTEALEGLFSSTQLSESHPSGGTHEAEVAERPVSKQRSSEPRSGDDGQEANGHEEMELEQQRSERGYQQPSEQQHFDKQHASEQQPDQRQGEGDSEDPWSDFETASKEENTQQRDSASPTGITAVADIPKEPTEQPAPKAPRHPPVPFPIDMSKLDDLFSTTDASFPTPEPVPDVIIDDTFTTISERKTWYRISRFGSKRKHDLGDDDNYVRLSWDKTHVREQTIRIVRRWMEEDSITGRVVLGRRSGAAGGHIFNWDTPAPAVEISELLNRRSHSRQASVASKATAASPVAANFGWNTSPIPSPTAATAQPSAPESRASTERSPNAKAFGEDTDRIPSPIAETKPPGRQDRPSSVASIQAFKPFPLQPVSRPVSISQPIMSPIMSPTSPLARPPEIADSSDDGEDDDDDWGEMVSSPAAETSGSFPSLNAIVDGSDNRNGGIDKSPVMAVPSPTTTAFGDWSTTEMKGNGRPSLDIRPSARMVSNHSRSATVDFNGFSQSSLNGSAPHPVSTKSDSAVDEINTSLGLTSSTLQRKTSPVQPISIMPPPSKPLGTLKSVSSKPRPQSLTLPPRQSPLSTVTTSDDLSQDDGEIIANILEGLPDLTYMLR